MAMLEDLNKDSECDDASVPEFCELQQNSKTYEGYITRVNPPINDWDKIPPMRLTDSP